MATHSTEDRLANQLGSLTHLCNTTPCTPSQMSVMENRRLIQRDVCNDI